MIGNQFSRSKANGVRGKRTIRYTSDKGFWIEKFGCASLILWKGICARDTITTEASVGIEDR